MARLLEFTNILGVFFVLAFAIIAFPTLLAIPKAILYNFLLLQVKELGLLHSFSYKHS